MESSDEDAQMEEGTASESEDDDQDDVIIVDEVLSTLGRKLDHENDLLDVSAEETLRRVIAHEKELLQVGEMVGQKGRPRQVVSDAALNERLGIIGTTTIRSIRIRKSTWNSKMFSKFLIDQINSSTLEDDSDADEPSPKDKNNGAVYSNLVDFLTAIQPGLVPDLATIYGSYATSKDPNTLPKTQTQKREAVKKEKGGSKKVRKVEEAEKVVLDGATVSTDHTMDRIIQLSQTLMEVFLETRRPVSLLRLCVDAESFTKTVENFFCFSFLIRDEKASLFLDNDKIPVCCPVGAGTEEDDSGFEELVKSCSQRKAGEDSFQQLMVNLTEDSWKNLVQTMAS